MRMSLRTRRERAPVAARAPAGEPLRTVRRALVAAVPVLLGLSGCGEIGVAALTDRIPPYVVPVSKPANPIERALAYCKEKTEAEETKCVKAGLAAAALSPSAVAAMIPKCHLGQVCD